MKKSYLNTQTGNIIDLEERALGYLINSDFLKEVEAPEKPDVVKTKKTK